MAGIRNKYSEQNIAFRIYNNGNDFLGDATIELPEVSYITDTLNGAGMAGEIESPVVGLTQSFTVKLTFLAATHPYYDINDWTASQLYECYSSMQVSDPTNGLRSNVPYRINFIGRVKTQSLGTLEQGKKHGNEVELEVTRLEVFLDGEEKLIIDKLNFIYRVNGDDKLASVRSDLGVSA